MILAAFPFGHDPLAILVCLIVGVATGGIIYQEGEPGGAVIAGVLFGVGLGAVTMVSHAWGLVFAAGWLLAEALYVVDARRRRWR